MLIKTANRREAYQAIINMALKDNRVYCNTCGNTYNPEAQLPCCEEPQIGTNADFAQICIKEVKDIKSALNNDYAAFSDKSMRWGLKLPPFLYQLLDEYERKYDRKFISNNEDIVWFAKNFPQFCIPNKL